MKENIFSIPQSNVKSYAHPDIMPVQSAIFRRNSALDFEYVESFDNIHSIDEMGLKNSLRSRHSNESLSPLLTSKSNDSPPIAVKVLCNRNLQLQIPAKILSIISPFATAFINEESISSSRIIDKANILTENEIFSCCNYCGKLEKYSHEFQVCSGCLKTCYCSAECQLSSWNLHKQSCYLA